MRKTLLYLLPVVAVLVSCEDRISPTLLPAEPVLVVDAWLNNNPGQQTIVLTQTQPYFENALPPGVSGANLSVVDDQGNNYLFVEDNARPGYYVWTPVSGEIFGNIGNVYTLNLQLNGQIYTATSKMGRVPVIDSITFEADKRVGTGDLFTRAEFWAIDPAGPGDAYWIRTYKNGVLLNKPAEINIAYDAGFSIGGPTDGVTFIAPIRRGINAVDKNEDGTFKDPLAKGDSIDVQIYSITKAAFTYLNEVQVQTQRPGGFQELFAVPLANVSTNIKNVNPSGPGALGFFNVSAISRRGRRFNGF